MPGLHGRHSQQGPQRGPHSAVAWLHPWTSSWTSSWIYDRSSSPKRYPFHLICKPVKCSAACGLHTCILQLQLQLRSQSLRRHPRLRALSHNLRSAIDVNACAQCCYPGQEAQLPETASMRYCATRVQRSGAPNSPSIMDNGEHRRMGARRRLPASWSSSEAQPVG